MVVPLMDTRPIKIHHRLLLSHDNPFHKKTNQIRVLAVLRLQKLYLPAAISRVMIGAAVLLQSYLYVYPF